MTPCVCVCLCVWWDNRRGRETADQRKVRLGVLVFICLTKFTDRGAEVEARRCPRSTGHKEDTERLKQVGGGEMWKEGKQRKKPNNYVRKAVLRLRDCHSAIDLTKLQIPSQDPLSLLHLAKARILIPAIIKLLTNSTYVSMSSSP